MSPMSLGMGVGLSDLGRVNPIVARATPGDYAALGGVTSFTNASANGVPSFIGSNGLVQFVNTNTLRDAHYVGGVRTILLESATEDILLQTENMTLGAVWSVAKANAGVLPAVTVNQGTAPDGAAAADKVVFIAPGAGDYSELRQFVTVVTGSQYRGGLWVKAFAAGDVGKILLCRHVGGGAYFNIVLTADWQRVGATVVAGIPAQSFSLILRPSSGSSSGTVAALFWGANLRLGTFEQSYVPATAATVIRAVDALTLAGSAVFGGASTLFYRYWDLATSAWVNLAAPYTPGDPITPAVDRAYADLAILRGSLSTAAAAQAMGY